MRTVILIMIAILLTGCRSKKVVMSVTSEKEIVQETAINKTENKVEKKENKQQSKTSEILEQKTENRTDFEIKGKVETGNPIEVYNVENGDTLQVIRVNGNADVHIRSKVSKLNHAKKEALSESLIDKFKVFSENIVEENNIKNRVQEIKQKTRDVKATGFQVGLWIFLAVLGIIGIVIFFTYKYLKK